MSQNVIVISEVPELSQNYFFSRFENSNEMFKDLKEENDFILFNFSAVVNLSRSGFKIYVGEKTKFFTVDYRVRFVGAMGIGFECDDDDLIFIVFDVGDANSVEFAKAVSQRLKESINLKVLVGRGDLTVSDDRVKYEQGVLFASYYSMVLYVELGEERSDLESLFSTSFTIYSAFIDNFKAANSRWPTNCISLSGCQMNVFPGFIGSRNKVMLELDISENRLITINCAELVGSKFSGLTSLNLSQNKLTKIPAGISTLVHLKNLRLKDNLLTHLPDHLSDCVNIKLLDISENQFTKFPYVLNHLKCLTELKVAGNPVFDSYDDFVCGSKVTGKNLKRLFKFVNLLENNETGKSNKVKVMFVGEGGVGKTSMIHCLRNNKGIDLYHNLATDGIDISGFGSDEISFDCWDFAGQKLYYTTHQFFLSKRSIYVIVFNLKDPNFSSVEYWFKSIRQRETSSPILLVGTHLDLCEKIEAEFNLQEILSMAKKYKIDGHVTISNLKKGNWITNFKRLLQDVAIKRRLIKDIPLYYLYVEKTLDKLREKNDYISVDEIYKNVSHLDKSLDEIITSLLYLHDTGNILFFEDDVCLRDFVILDPQYLPDIMSTIVTLTNVYSDGKLSEDQMTMILKSYSPDQYSGIIKILQRFEIVFTLKTETTLTYVVPSLLHGTPPPAYCQFARHPQENQKQFGRIYQFNFVPIGFFPRLITRSYLMTDFYVESLWENGYLFRYKNQEGLVEYDPIEYTLLIMDRYIENTDKFNDNALSMLIQAIDSLISVFHMKDEHKMSITIPLYFGPPSDDPPLILLKDVIAVFLEGIDIVVNNIVFPYSVIAPDIAEIESIALKDVTISKELGQGGFGTVYKGLLNGDTVVAVKTLKLKGIEDELSKFKEFVHEVNLMRKFDHPNLIKLYGTSTKPLAMIIEYCPHKSLEVHLHDKEFKNSDFPDELRWKIIKDIALGLHCLHSFTPPVLHRDIRSPNVFVSSLDLNDKINAKLGDFGLAQYSIPHLSDMLNTWQWMAPEVIDFSDFATYGTAADVYSLGIVLWEIIERELPFSEFTEYLHRQEYILSESEMEDNIFQNSLRLSGFEIDPVNKATAFQESFKEQEIKSAIIHNDLRPSITRNIPDSIREILSLCWKSDPNDRPSIPQVVQALNNAGTIKQNSWVRANYKRRESASSILRLDQGENCFETIAGILSIDKITLVNPIEQSDLKVSIRYGPAKIIKNIPVEISDELTANINVDFECWNISKVRIRVQAKKTLKTQFIGQVDFYVHLGQDTYSLGPREFKSDKVTGEMRIQWNFTPSEKK